MKSLKSILCFFILVACPFLSFPAYVNAGPGGSGGSDHIRQVILQAHGQLVNFVRDPINKVNPLDYPTYSLLAKKRQHEIDVALSFFNENVEFYRLRALTLTWGFSSERFFDKKGVELSARAQSKGDDIVWNEKKLNDSIESFTETMAFKTFLHEIGHLKSKEFSEGKKYKGLDVDLVFDTVAEVVPTILDETKKKYLVLATLGLGEQLVSTANDLVHLGRYFLCYSLGEYSRQVVSIARLLPTFNAKWELVDKAELLRFRCLRYSERIEEARQLELKKIGLGHLLDNGEIDHTPSREDIVGHVQDLQTYIKQVFKIKE